VVSTLRFLPLLALLLLPLTFLGCPGAEQAAPTPAPTPRAIRVLDQREVRKASDLAVVLEYATHLPRQKADLEGEPEASRPSPGPGFFASALVKIRPLSAAEAAEFGVSDKELKRAGESETEVDLIWRTADGNDFEGPEPSAVLGEPGARAATEIEPGSYYRWIELQEPIQADEELRLYVRVRRTWSSKEGQSGRKVVSIEEVQYRVLGAGKN